jgi:hypothetical protein
MANMKPVAIDQTTGQQRPVSDNDSMAGNLGAEIEIAITWPGDYNGNVPNVHALFPWSNVETLGNPASLPTGAGRQAAWSPGGEFLAVSHWVSPGVSIYQRTGKTFTRLPNPSVPPSGNQESVIWGPGGEFLTLAGGASKVAFYQRSGTTFTKLTSPASMPAGNVQWAAGSPTGEIITCVTDTSPFIHNYRRDGTTYTLLAQPSSLPPATVRGVAWSPNGAFFAIAHSTTPWMNIYRRDGAGPSTTFTKLDDPSTIPPSSGGHCAWSPTGEFLDIIGVASGHTMYQVSGSTFTALIDPFDISPSSTDGAAWDPSGRYLAFGANVAGVPLEVYERSGTSFTKLADPASAPTGFGGRSPGWSPDRQFLAVPNQIGDFIHIYQTGDDMPDSGIMTITGNIK